MKKILLPFIFLLISLSSAFSQQKWFDQCFDPEDRYCSIYFADSLNGWIGASYGKIYHTTDGGNSWSLQKLPKPYDVTSLHFFDANTGWAVGFSPGHMGAMSFLGYTTDGGNTWQSKTIENYPFRSDTVIEYISFCDRNNGVICGLADVTSKGDYSATIIKTTDGGKTWSVKYFPDEKIKTTVFPKDIKIISPDRVLVASIDRDLVSTTDAGKSWNIFNPIDSKYFTAYTSISFADNNTGWISGKSGTIIKTTDAGASWTRLNPDTTISYNGISFLDKNFGLAVGYIGNISLENNKNVIVRTTDGGLIWTTDTVYVTGSVSGITYMLSKVYIAPSGRAWAFHGSTVLSTLPFKSAPGTKIINYDSIFCSGDSTILHSWPQGQEFSYLWSTGDTNANIVVKKGGLYTVIVKNQYGSGTASANIIVYQRPIVKLNYSGKLTLCKGDSIILKTNIEHGQYAWYNDYDGSSMIVKQSGRYWLMASDSTGCWARSDTLDVEFVDAPDFIYKFNRGYLDFDPVDMGKSSEMDFSLNNQGSDFNIDTAYISGDTGVFTLTTVYKFPLSLKNKESKLFTVKFSPKEEKFYDANLIINVSSQCRKVIEIPVNGFGQIPSSVNENAAVTNDGIKLYPNPVSDRLNIVFADKNMTASKVSIINQLGECLLEKDFSESSSDLKMDIGSLPPGIYYCKVIATKTAYFAKFVIIR